MPMITPGQPLALPIGPGWTPSPTSIYRITVDQYEAMVASGVFGSHERVHLVDGILVIKMTEKPPDVIACELTRDALLRIVPAGWRVMTEAPVRIPDYNEPEPDVTVARGSARDAVYRQRHPEPGDIALIVEVADASLEEDLKLAHTYAVAGIPIYWVLNLVEQKLVVFSDPGPAGYRSIEHLTVGHAVPLIIDRNLVERIAVADLMP
jgi:Uma2 family endonuclease